MKCIVGLMTEDRCPDEATHYVGGDYSRPMCSRHANGYWESGMCIQGIAPGSIIFGGFIGFSGKAMCHFCCKPVTPLSEPACCAGMRDIRMWPGSDKGSTDRGAAEPFSVAAKASGARGSANPPSVDPLSDTFTATGRRYSAPALQNIPLRTEIGRKLREMFSRGAKR
jgi:hypothetical protein